MSISSSSSLPKKEDWYIDITSRGGFAHDQERWWLNRSIVMVLFRNNEKDVSTSSSFRTKVCEKGHDFEFQLIRRITCMPRQSSLVE